MKISILKCSACGKPHSNVRVDKLPSPELINTRSFSHACTCPLTGEIIYVEFVSDTITEFHFPREID